MASTSSGSSLPVAVILSIVPDTSARNWRTNAEVLVRSLDDAIWRRTKQGMWLTAEQQARISEWLAQHAGKSELSLAS